MSMRIFSTSALGLVLALTACGEKPKEIPKTESEVASQVEENQNLVPCAVGGAAQMAKMCTYETANGEQGLTIVIRHADGAFRRLLVTNDGNVVAADGADEASFTMMGADQIEVSLGGDRYQLPATVKPPA
jgi:hypothetical protein